MILTCPFCHVKVERDARECRVCHRTMARACPHCAEEISVLAGICKYCGENVVPQPVVPAVAARPSQVRTVESVASEEREIEFVGGVKYVPWEDRAKRGVFRKWWSSWAASQFRPGSFWSALPVEGGHTKPNAYTWFMLVHALILALPLLMLLGAAANASRSEFVAATGVYLALFPLTFVAVAVLNYAGAILWHVPAKILLGKAPFQGTLRIVAYNSGALLWLVVPFLGVPMAAILSIVGSYHGFRQVHGMGWFRSLLMALAPLIVLVGLGAGALGLAACGAVCPR